MDPFRVKIQIGILVIIFSINGCKKTEPQDILAITTDEILIASHGVYTFKGTILSIGKEEISDHGFC